MQTHDRFKDALWYKAITRNYPIDFNTGNVTVGGAGGIGSWVAFFLARMGIVPSVYDFDTISEHNIGGQFFRASQVGSAKVEALANNLNEFTDAPRIYGWNQAMTGESLCGPIFFSCFDNMQARRETFQAWSAAVHIANSEYKHHCVFIDGRLLMEQMEIYCIRLSDKEAMERYWQNDLPHDSEIPDEPCSLKQTTHTAAMIASHMVGFFTNHLCAVEEGATADNISESPFCFPYKWTYYVPLNLFHNSENVREHELSES